jgi:hypothetical protein
MMFAGMGLQLQFGRLSRGLVGDPGSRIGNAKPAAVRYERRHSHLGVVQPDPETGPTTEKRLTLQAITRLTLMPWIG